MRDLRKPIQRRAIRNARIRAFKYCVVTTSLMGIFTICLSIALQQ